MSRVRFSALTLVVASLSVLTSCLGDDDFVDPIEQFKKETDAIDNYLDSQGLTAQIDTGGYELRYIIHDKGAGDAVDATDVSIVSVKARTLYGATFFWDEDSISIGVNRWLAAYQILLPYLNEGGSMTMYIPSYYGYGQNSAFDGSVPPNSTLVVEVEVKQSMEQFDFEQLRIDQYLEDNELTAEIDTVYGLRYIITEEGDGETYPTTSDVVNVDYDGSLLSSGESFDSNVGVDFNLQGLIQGWRILMPYVSEGGQIKMFIPSKYGYGATGSGSIPGYATLVFDVKLNTVK